MFIDEKIASMDRLRRENLKEELEKEKQKEADKQGLTMRLLERSSLRLRTLFFRISRDHSKLRERIVPSANTPGFWGVAGSFCMRDIYVLMRTRFM